MLDPIQHQLHPLCSPAEAKGTAQPGAGAPGASVEAAELQQGFERVSRQRGLRPAPGSPAVTAAPR